VKGSEQGFEKLVEEEKAGGKKAEEQKLAQGMMNKPAIGFALKDLGGKTVTLKSLKGKVVVVDFWATWCGPCKSSFPFLQQVYEKYKTNASVMILAVNTWENKAGGEREALVKAFLAENKYTFPVLYDEGIVEKYGVEGIPTKFVIDRRGMIRFKSVGFENGAKMVGELTAQIDRLLSDKFYEKTSK
jgi:thiol-disulfide isomerase/thioredoxin